MQGRLFHLWRITRWGWFVVYELGWITVFVNLDLIIGKYGSEKVRVSWDRLIHPHWGWRNWLIGALVILVLSIWEGSYKEHSKLSQKVSGLEVSWTRLVYDHQR